MSDVIDIVKDGFIFDYHYEFGFKLQAEITEYKSHCQCNRYLTYAYLYIIHNLKEAGLLPESYKEMCCFCNMLACIGFRVPDEWYGTFIENFSETQIDGVTTLVIGSYLQESMEYFEFEIRIYDVDLSLKTGRIINDVGYKWDV